MRNKKCDEFLEEKSNENKFLESQINTNNNKLEELIEKKKENIKEIGKGIDFKGAPRKGFSRAGPHFAASCTGLFQPKILRGY